MSNLTQATERLTKAVEETRLAMNAVKYEMAVDRDNQLTTPEQIAYLEALIWAEERGLK